jgi:hypothetical protein
MMLKLLVSKRMDHILLIIGGEELQIGYNSVYVDDCSLCNRDAVISCWYDIEVESMSCVILSVVVCHRVVSFR